jgi:hypothetical protein
MKDFSITVIDQGQDLYEIAGTMGCCFWGPLMPM